MTKIDSCVAQFIYESLLCTFNDVAQKPIVVVAETPLRCMGDVFNVIP